MLTNYVKKYFLNEFEMNSKRIFKFSINKTLPI